MFTLMSLDIIYPVIKRLLKNLPLSTKPAGQCICQAWNHLYDIVCCFVVVDTLLLFIFS